MLCPAKNKILRRHPPPPGRSTVSRRPVLAAATLLAAFSSASRSTQEGQPVRFRNTNAGHRIIHSAPARVTPLQPRRSTWTRLGQFIATPSSPLSVIVLHHDRSRSRKLHGRRVSEVNRMRSVTVVAGRAQSGSRRRIAAMRISNVDSRKAVFMHARHCLHTVETERIRSRGVTLARMQSMARFVTGEVVT